MSLANRRSTAGRQKAPTCLDVARAQAVMKFIQEVEYSRIDEPFYLKLRLLSNLRRSDVDRALLLLHGLGLIRMSGVSGVVGVEDAAYQPPAEIGLSDMPTASAEVQ